MEYSWNPWHGCHKLSPGCKHCYVYRIDAAHGREPGRVTRNADFDLPLQRGRSGYKIPSGSLVYTCFSSDFLVEDADGWRPEVWDCMRQRPDLDFLFITKRIDRFLSCVPDDWGDGYPNVSVGCTCENQSMAEYRLPFFLEAPIIHKFIVCEPLLERIDFTDILHDPGKIEQITVGGESGPEARVCDYDWVLGIRDFCISANVPFRFRQTGANFRRGGKVFRIRREFQHSQAKRAGIDWH